MRATSSSLVVFAVLFLTLSAAAQESGAPAALSKSGATGTPPDRYRESLVLFTPKNSTGGASHTGKCYENAEIADILTAYPGLHVTDDAGTGLPTYLTYPTVRYPAFVDAATWHDHVEALKPGARARLCLNLRPDVYRKFTVCNGGANVGLACQQWNASTCPAPGSCAGVHDETPLGAFSDAWLVQVPKAWWTDYITSEWGGGLCTTCSANNGPDGTWLTNVRGLSDDTEPLPYGGGNTTQNRIDWQGYLVVDVRIEAYQDWWVSAAVQKLRESHAGCITIAFKPGWWILSQVPYAAEACATPPYKVPAGGMGYEGFAHNGLCSGGTNPGAHCTISDSSACTGAGATCSFACNARSADPVMPTPFARGEYERAMNAILRKLFSALDANGRCSDNATNAFSACTTNAQCTGAGATCQLYTGAQVHLQERPDYADKRWVALDADVIANAHLGGEEHNPTPAPLCSGPCTETTCNCPNDNSCPL